MSGIMKSVLKAIVSPLSVTLAITGIGLLVVGILGTSLLSSFLPTILSFLRNPPGLEKTITDNINPFFSVAQYLGGVLAFIGIFGVVVSCWGNSILLRLYGVMALILAGIFAIILFQFTSGSVETSLKGYLKETIRKDYYGFDNKNITSLAWTAITILLRCCGVDNYGDFNETENWNRSFVFAENRSIYQISPISCCALNVSLPAIPDISTLSGLISLPTELEKLVTQVTQGDIFTSFITQFFNNTQCSAAPTATNSNYMTGCWSKAISMISSYFTIFKYVFYGLIAAPILIALIAIAASLQMMTEKDKPNDKSKDKAK